MHFQSTKVYFQSTKVYFPSQVQSNFRDPGNGISGTRNLLSTSGSRNPFPEPVTSKHRTPKPSKPRARNLLNPEQCLRSGTRFLPGTAPARPEHTKIYIVQRPHRILLLGKRCNSVQTQNLLAKKVDYSDIWRAGKLFGAHLGHNGPIIDVVSGLVFVHALHGSLLSDPGATEVGICGRFIKFRAHTSCNITSLLPILHLDGCVYMYQLWKNKRSFKTHPTTTRVVLCMLGQVGFLKLIQKEWCSFGHRFRTRLASHWHVGHVKLVIDRPVGSGRRTDWFQLFVQKDIIYRSMDLTFYVGILFKDAVLWQTNLSLSTKWWM